MIKSWRFEHYLLGHPVNSLPNHLAIKRDIPRWFAVVSLTLVNGTLAKQLVSEMTGHWGRRQILKFNMAWLNGSKLKTNNAMEWPGLELRLPHLKFEALKTFRLACLHKHHSTATEKTNFTLFSESSVVACSVTSSLISVFTGSFACWSFSLTLVSWGAVSNFWSCVLSEHYNQKRRQLTPS